MTCLFALLYSQPLFALVPVPAPPAGTPELPVSFTPFLLAIAIGGAVYWRVGKNKKNKNDDHSNKQDRN